MTVSIMQFSCFSAVNWICPGPSIGLMPWTKAFSTIGCKINLGMSWFSRWAQAQEKLGQTEVSASAGGGMVKVTGTADGRITSITIDPEALDPEDVEMLQDSILAAVNDCLESGQSVANQQMGAITGGMNIPGMF